MNPTGTLPTPGNATGAGSASTETPTKTVASRTPTQLGLGLLVALVVGSIIGSGIFGLPQNMAAGASAGAILIGWTVTGIGAHNLVAGHTELTLPETLPIVGNMSQIPISGIPGKGWQVAPQSRRACCARWARPRDTTATRRWACSSMPNSSTPSVTAAGPVRW